MTPIYLLAELYYAAKPRVYYIGGALFCLFGALDVWAFQFNPLQVNIFLDTTKDDASADVSVLKESKEINL